MVGWFMDQPMDLNMEMFETATLFITVVTVAFVCQAGWVLRGDVEGVLSCSIEGGVEGVLRV